MKDGVCGYWVGEERAATWGGSNMGWNRGCGSNMKRDEDRMMMITTRVLDRNIEQQRDRIRGEQIIKDSGRDRACVRVRACTRMRREMCVAVVRRYCFGRREYKFKSQVRERRTVNGQRPGALPRQYRREERSRARAACTHHPQHYSSVSSRRCSLPVSRAAAAAAARPALAAAAG